MTRVAVVQTKPVLGRPKDNGDRALALMEANPADIYVLPELAFSGYKFTSAQALLPLAETAEAGPEGDRLREFCRRKKAWAAYGFPERAGEHLFNSALLLGPAGNIGLYRKIHLFGGEKALFSPGDLPLPTYSLPFGRVGLMICFDWFFPEVARTLALGGAQLILHPSNLVLPYCPEAMITRCLENRVFAATADRVGEDSDSRGSLAFIGQSQLVAPTGKVLLRMDGQAEGVGITDIDLSQADSKKLSTGDDLFKDRRPEFYKL